LFGFGFFFFLVFSTQVINKEISDLNENELEMKKRYSDPNFWMAFGLSNGMDRFQLSFFASLFVGSVIGSRTALETSKNVFFL
jgi:hypothetical protein